MGVERVVRWSRRSLSFREAFFTSGFHSPIFWFKRVILWGLSNENSGSHFYIYHAYHQTCQKLGINVVWVDDLEANVGCIGKRDLVFVHGSACRWLRNIWERGAHIVEFNARYFENADVAQQLYAESAPRIIGLRERPEEGAIELDPVTFWNEKKSQLTTPWGADLLPQEFGSPAEARSSDSIYWVGAWWKDELWGNHDEIAKLKECSAAVGLRFVQLTGCTTRANKFFIRNSRIAPSIAGSGQVKWNYIACRFFKNIAYGQFAISNVASSLEIFGDTVVYSNEIEDLVHLALEVSSRSQAERVSEQQKICRNFTIASHLAIVAAALLDWGKS